MHQKNKRKIVVAALQLVILKELRHLQKALVSSHMWNVGKIKWLLTVLLLKILKVLVQDLFLKVSKHKDKEILWTQITNIQAWAN